jgi:hypothetical protein
VGIEKPGDWNDPAAGLLSQKRMSNPPHQNMPSTMAPTKAKAMYAVTTLNLLTKGRKVIGILPS